MTIILEWFEDNYGLSFLKADLFDQDLGILYRFSRYLIIEISPEPENTRTRLKGRPNLGGENRGKSEFFVNVDKNPLSYSPIFFRFPSFSLHPPPSLVCTHHNSSLIVQVPQPIQLTIESVNAMQLSRTSTDLCLQCEAILRPDRGIAGLSKIDKYYLFSR